MIKPAIALMLLVSVFSLSACGVESSQGVSNNDTPIDGGSTDDGSTDDNPDTDSGEPDTNNIPDVFSFAAQTDVALSRLIVSNKVTITGLSHAAKVTIENGEYAIDNANFTQEEGLIESGQRLQLRLTSSSNPSTTTTATLRIGSFEAKFNVITRSADAVDTSPPVITLAGDDPFSLPQGEAYVEPGYEVQDNSGTAEVEISGTVNVDIPGEYVLTYSAIDSSGNTAVVTRRVVVVQSDNGQPDITPPVITIIGDRQAIHGHGADYIDPGATATDNRDTAVTVTAEGTVKGFSIGEYTITYTATDAAGNQATAIRTVRVVDLTPPELVLKAGTNYETALGESFEDPGINRLRDNISGNSNIRLIIEGADEVNTNVEGHYIVTYTAIDEAGNSTVVKRTVTVRGELALLSLSLVNAETGVAIDGFNPMDVSSRNIINLDELGTDKVAVVAETSGLPGSVFFSVYRQTSATKDYSVFHIDNTAPFSSTPADGNAFEPLNLPASAANYAMFARAHKGPNSTRGHAGKFEVQLRFLRSNILPEHNSYELLGNVGSNDSPSTNLVLHNTGNNAGEFFVVSKPDWLELSTGNASVGIEQTILADKGTTTTLTLSAPSCSQVRDLSGELVIAGPLLAPISLPIHARCDDLPDFDIAIFEFLFNQGVRAQSSVPKRLGNRIPLVDRRPGVVRVLATRNGGTEDTPPRAVFNYLTPNGEQGSIDLDIDSPLPLVGSLPQGTNGRGSSYRWIFDESDFDSVLMDGTQYFVEIDPDNTTSERSKLNNRYPRQGYATLRVKQQPPLVVKLVPVSINSRVAPDIDNDRAKEILVDTMDWFPVSELVHEVLPVYSSSAGSYGVLLQEIRQLRDNNGDDKSVVYVSFTSGNFGSNNAGGMGDLINRVAWKDLGTGIASPDTAHEIGHALGLNHAPCGVAGGDPHYPGGNAQYSSKYGFVMSRWFTPELKDRSAPEFWITSSIADFMSYCGLSRTGRGPSEYYYRKTMMLENQTHRDDSSLSELDPFAMTAGSQLKTLSSAETLMVEGSIRTYTEGTLSSIQAVQGAAALDDADINGEFIVFNADDLAIYKTDAQVWDLPHTDVRLFRAYVPQAYIDEAASLVIYRNGEAVYEQQLEPVATLASKTTAIALPAVVRVSDDSVEVTWSQQGLQYLQVLDAATHQLLGTDRSGTLSVQTTAERLLLKINDRGRITTHLVEVEQ